jgi:hypothetical protein
MNTKNRLSLRTGLSAFAVAECLLICPAAFFILVAGLHSRGPGEYELAHSSGIMLEWMKSHLTRVHAAIMFIVFPGVAFTLGIGTLLQSWQQDELFRWDAMAFAAVLRRNWHFIIVSLGAAGGVAILMAAIVHMITD